MGERGARRPWKVALVLLALLQVAVLQLLSAAPASAHAELVGTDPAEGAVLATAPGTVVLTFTEPVDLVSQPISLHDATGDVVATDARVEGAEVSVDVPDADALADGTYVLTWRVLSDDGHPLAGTLTFSVGAPSPRVVPPPAPASSSAAVTALRDVVTGVTLVGLLLAAGLALFVVLVLPRSWAGAAVRARLRRVVARAGAVAVAGAVVQVPLASAYAQGLELVDVVPGFDPALVGDAVASAAVTVSGLVVLVRALGDAPPGDVRGRVIGTAAVLALAGPSLVGHTRAFAPSPVLVTWDVIHVTAGAIWLGGLVGLVLTVRSLAGRELLAAQVLARFSTLAAWSLVVVAAAGAFLTWRVLGSWSGFVETSYGRLLLVKIGLALVVAAMGAWNRWRTVPAVRTASGFADRGRAAGLVARTVRVEAVLLVVLLGVTGFLVDQSPRPAPDTVSPASDIRGRG